MQITISTKQHPKGESFDDPTAHIVNEIFLVHRQLNEKDGRSDLYAVSHRPTGYLIYPNLSVEDALWFARALRASVWNFADPQSVPLEVRDDYEIVCFEFDLQTPWEFSDSKSPSEAERQDYQRVLEEWMKNRSERRK